MRELNSTARGMIWFRVLVVLGILMLLAGPVMWMAHVAMGLVILAIKLALLVLAFVVVIHFLRSMLKKV